MKRVKRSLKLCSKTIGRAEGFFEEFVDKFWQKDQKLPEHFYLLSMDMTIGDHKYFFSGKVKGFSILKQTSNKEGQDAMNHTNGDDTVHFWRV